ncbi:hypothetical protein WDU94_003128 [Cyamophila willieti]
MVRFKNRYLTIQISPPGNTQCNQLVNIHSHHVYQAIRLAIKSIHGDYGLACVQNIISVKYLNPKTRIAFIRVPFGPHKLLTSVLPVIKQIDKLSVQVSVLHVSATIRQCFKFVKDYQHRHLEQLWNSLSPSERDNFKSVVLSLDVEEKSAPYLNK